MPSEHRLHPIALLLTLGKHIKEAGLALAGALFASSGDGEIAGIPWQAIVGGLTLLLVIGPTVTHYLTFRYRYEPDDLVIRTGWLSRSERHVPYARIQSLDAREGLLHRLVGAVGVTLETGGGGEAEGSISAISRSAFEQMRLRVQPGTHRVEAGAEGEIATGPPTELLSQFDDREALLSGLVLGRGMFVIGTVIALLVESGVFRPFMDWLFTDVAHDGRLSSMFTQFEAEDNYFGASLLIAALIVLFVLSVRLLASVMTAVRFYRHRLERQGDDLRVTCGLLTRSHSTTPIHRIQSLTVLEGPWHRLARRVTVQAGSAGGAGEQHQVASRETVVPLLRPTALLPLMAIALRGLQPPDVPWRRSAPGAWKRVILPQLLGWCIPIALMTYIHPYFGMLGVLLLGISMMAAAFRVQHFRWVVFDRGVGLRSGWLWRQTTWVRFDRIQLAQYRHSPFDRRHNMASVSVDTAGVGSPVLELRWLTREDATTVVEQLNHGIASTEFSV